MTVTANALATSRKKHMAVLVLGVLATACGEESADGIPDAAIGALADATVFDSSTATDAAVDGSLGPDAAAPGVVIDGVVDPVEWAAATSYTNSVAVDAPFAGNGLEQLLIYRDDADLYLAIAGTLTGGNAIVLYLDHDLSGVDGLVSPASLDDTVGALDLALSRVLVSPGEFRVDYGFGVLDMNRAATPGDDRMGWRDVATNPQSFAQVVGETVCSTNGCETSIPLANLAVDASDQLGVAVRLGSATSGQLSNQTLPQDPQSDSITVYATVP
jgi:hypothetical protein